MKPSLPAALSSLAFAFGYLLFYFISTVLPTPLLWYDPLGRRFLFQVEKSGLGMDFYGRVLLCLAGGGALLLVSRFIGGRLRSSVRVLHGLLVWVISLWLFTGGLYIYLLAHRTPMPLPLPSLPAQADVPR